MELEMTAIEVLVRIAAWIVIFPAGLFFVLILAVGIIQHVIDWVHRGRA